MTARLDRLRGHLPRLVRWGGLTDWERGFAISCLGQSRRRPEWLPSERQAKVLAPLVDRWLREMLGESGDTECPASPLSGPLSGHVGSGRSGVGE